MKQCPSCLTTYTDDTLSYCLADGTRLDAAADEQRTQLRAGSPAFGDKTIALDARDKLRIEIADQARSSPVPPSPSVVSPGNQASSMGGILKIAAVIAAILVVALFGLGGVGLLVYFSSGQAPVAANTKPSPVPSSSPRRADDADESRDQIANLQRQLDEQKRTSSNRGVPLSIPKTADSTSIAKANSPNDGFLALRSLPNSEIGDRIAKIPHGSSVAIGGCGPVVKKGSRSGRWCQARYGGMSGWVFDAYLSY